MAGRPVNVDLLRQKAQDIRQPLRLLRGYTRRPRAEFLADAQSLDAAKYRLLVAIEAAIGMRARLSTHLSGTTPNTYAECFRQLAATNRITPQLAERMSELVRLRYHLEMLTGRSTTRILRTGCKPAWAT